MIHSIELPSVYSPAPGCKRLLKDDLLVLFIITMWPKTRVVGAEACEVAARRHGKVSGRRFEM
jgi:hypothetical protein